MRYFVLLKGEGTGCDYTIECNKDYRELEAKTREDALAEVEGICDGYGEPDIEEAMILQVEDAFNFDTGIITRRREQAREDEGRAAEEREFDRLRKKLGK